MTKKHMATPVMQGFEDSAVIVDLAERSYPIYIGHDIFSDLGKCMHCHFESALPGKVVIITDDNVGPLYAAKIKNILKEAGFQSNVIEVPHGEKTKRLAMVEEIYEQLFDLALERSDVILALGGGVVGDLAGFVAATYKRGVNLVQVPTTLLAMVDSSVGGKTGVNHSRGKNMIGAFYQPRMVFADTISLKTLPKRELGCGLAETVKHALIRQPDFFELLEDNVSDILNLKKDLVIELVIKNCQIKTEIVSGDEREQTGLRSVLNLGHTIGHTFETVLCDCDIHHGEAVSLGIAAETYISVNRKMLKPETKERIHNLLQAFNLPVTWQGELPVNKLCSAMLHDKKVTNGKINFVLTTGLGNYIVMNDISQQEIVNAIKSLQS